MSTPIIVSDDLFDYLVDWLLPNEETGCWEWSGSVEPSGYGRIQIARQGYMVHRLSYELLVGPIPDGLCLHHECENRLCARPDHLRPVTRAEHIYLHKMWERRTQGDHCARGHALTIENTIFRGRHGRRCRTCQNASQRAAYWRHREVVGKGHGS